MNRDKNHQIFSGGQAVVDLGDDVSALGVPGAAPLFLVGSGTENVGRASSSSS